MENEDNQSVSTFNVFTVGAVSFILGVAVTVSLLPVTETETVYETNWEQPDDQTVKYTIKDVDGTIKFYDRDGHIVDLEDYEEEVEYYDETLRVRGGEILLSNGVREVPFDTEEDNARLSIGGIDYKKEIYQGGQVIDSHESTCWPNLNEIRPGDVQMQGDMERAIYSQCFDVEVSSER